MTEQQPTRPGARVYLIATADQRTRLQPHATGTVDHVDAAGTVHVTWDDGSRLGLIPGTDQWAALHPRWDVQPMVQTYAAHRAEQHEADDEPCVACGGDRLRPDFTASGRCHASTEETSR